MNCKTIQAHLSAYIDRELNSEETREVRTHLMECAACRAEEMDLRSLKSLLGGIQVPEPSPDFEKRLVSCVHRADKEARSPRWIGATILFAGVAAASMLITLSYVSHDTNPRATGVSTFPTRDIGFQVQRDQMYSISADPMSGSPVLAPTSYGH